MKFSFIHPMPNGYATMMNSSPPLGILYIASALEKEGIEVSIFDQAALGSSIRAVEDWVSKENPDILGISTLGHSSLIAPKIAKEVKKKNPKTLIVLGNHHATFNAEKLLEKYPFVDIIVRGEGEQTCLELINYIIHKKSLKEILGVTFRHNEQIISNPDRPLIKDIDLLPFPNRKLLCVEYHNTTMGINVSPKKFTTFLSSRGCLFKCHFCSCMSIARNTWRHRSIKNMLDELHFLNSEGYKQLMFVDDNFTLNQKRVIELCKAMRKEKINIEWICEGRADQCSYNMLKEMVKAGCRMMYFGLESANQHVLNYYKKGITPKQSEIAVAKARQAGIDVIVGSFIIGAPNETKKDIQKTFDFAQRIEVDIPQINLLEANPGTPIWDEFKNNGLLNEENFWETGVFISDISQNTVPSNELKLMISYFYKTLLINPQYILKQLSLTIGSSYRQNVVLNNLNRINAIRDNINTL